MCNCGDFYQCVRFYQFVLNVELCWFIIWKKFGVDFVNCGVIFLVGNKDVVEGYIRYCVICCFDYFVDSFQNVVGLCFWVIGKQYVIMLIKSQCIGDIYYVISQCVGNEGGQWCVVVSGNNYGFWYC